MADLGYQTFHLGFGWAGSTGFRQANPERFKEICSFTGIGRFFQHKSGGTVCMSEMALDRIDGFREAGIARLVFRNKKSWGAFAFLCVWLIGWAAGEWFAIQKFSQGEPSTFLMVWLSVWTLGGVVSMFASLGLIAGTEVIEVADGELRIAYKSGPFGSRRRFPLSDVSDLRVLEEFEVGHEETSGPKQLAIGVGRLGFLYHANGVANRFVKAPILIRVGRDLDDSQGRYALRWLIDAAPELDRVLAD
jgi:hypothetical protein